MDNNRVVGQTTAPRLRLLAAHRKVTERSNAKAYTGDDDMCKETDILDDMVNTFDVAERVAKLQAELYRRVAEAARVRDSEQVIAIIGLIEQVTGGQILDDDDRRAVLLVHRKGKEHGDAV